MASSAGSKIVVVGVALVQLRLRVESLPHSGGDVLASAWEVGLGGSGINVARTLAQLGAPLEFVLHRGEGPLDRMAQAELRRLRIPVRGGRSRESSGVTIALVEPNGERSLVSAAGAEGRVGAKDLRRADLGDAALLYVSGYELLSSPDLEETVAALPERIRVVLDPGPRGADPATLRRAWDRAVVVRLNAREAAARSGVTEPWGAVAALSRNGPAVVVSTRQGAFLGQRGEVQEIRSGPPVAGDTTGAGDAQTAGILAALLAGRPIPDAVAAGNRVAGAQVAGARIVPGLLD